MAAQVIHEGNALDGKGEQGKAPLHNAAEAGSTAVLKLLLRYDVEERAELITRGVIWQTATKISLMPSKGWISGV